MKKFINDVDALLSESLDGFAAAHADIVVLEPGRRFMARARTADPQKVRLISGGGSGHEPLHIGFIGSGMLDAACPGKVFTSPTPDQMLAAAEAVGGTAGTLFIVKNYEGDVMNFEMAADMAGGQLATVITNDDVAVEASTHSTGRRGVAGTVVVEKIVGASAERGLGLPELKALGERINGATRSIGVALTSCTVPAIGSPTFELAAGEIEFGVGIHGEPGRRRERLRPAREIADEMIEAITVDWGMGSDVLLFINGLGATPPIELYLMYDQARKQLERHRLRIRRSLVGTFVTSLDMAGCSVTVTALDDGFAEGWDAPVHTAALRWGA